MLEDGSWEDNIVILNKLLKFYSIGLEIDKIRIIKKKAIIKAFKK